MPSPAGTDFVNHYTIGSLLRACRRFPPQGRRKELSYRGHFDIEVAGDPHQIDSVVLLRSDHNTHSLTTGDRYVKLAFRQRGRGRDDARGLDDDEDEGELRLTFPRLPAQAIPGIYMLFVVNKAGVPSVGRQIRIRPERRGRD